VARPNEGIQQTKPAQVTSEGCMTSRLQTLATAGGMAVANIATFAILLLIGLSRSPMAGLSSFVVAGMVVAIWTSRLPTVVISAALVSGAGALMLAWAQLIVDNQGAMTITGAVRLGLRWPGVSFLGLGVIMACALGSAGWAAARYTASHGGPLRGCREAVEQPEG
jgi:hypothetical protein